MSDERTPALYSQKQAQGLARRLAETEAALAATRDGLVDALLDPSGPLLLADAQQALRESEREFRAVFFGSSDGLVVADKGGICLDANPAAHAIAHLSDGALIGASLIEIVGLKGPDQPRPGESGGPEGQEGHQEITLPDGETRIIEYSLAPDVLPGKDLWIVRDITRRKAAEDYQDMGREIVQILNEPGELSDSLQRVVTTLKTGTGFDAVGIRLQEGEDFPYAAEDGFPDGFLVTENTLIERDAGGGVCRDLDGRVNLECTCGLVVSGRTDPANPRHTPGGSAWTNDSFPTLDIPPEEDPRHNPRNVCIHHGYASIAQVPIRDQERIVGLIHLNDRRKGRLSLDAVELLERIAAQVGTGLMRKEAERALAASEEQLRQSQKAEAVGQLAGGIAHDFNNLLTPIIGLSEFLLEGWGTKEAQRSDAEEIRKAAERAATLTRQLLAFSRQQPLWPRVLDLNEALTSIGALLSRVLGEHISLEVCAAADLGRVEADPGQVEHVILNLAINARDAMPDGGSLTIETSNVLLGDDYVASHLGAKPGAHVMLTITDNGCGMTDETWTRIFDPFFTTKELGKGTGLGLSTVYGIVTQSEGYIWVTSELGKGTTFEIYLPAVEGPLETAPNSSSKDMALEHAAGSETLLLVEDEPSVQALAKRVLAGQGYVVLSAGSAGEAIELVEAHSGEIDLVVSDVVLPGMGSRQLVETLQARWPAMKALYMSGYAHGAIVHHGRLDPGIAFLEKPFTPQGLSAAVRSVLDGSAVDKDGCHRHPFLVSIPQSVESTATQPEHRNRDLDRSTDCRGAGAPLRFAHPRRARRAPE